MKAQDGQEQASSLQTRVLLWLDWLMLALAVGSVGLLIYEMYWPVSEERRKLIYAADLWVCGIFAVEFIFRWTRDTRPKTFALRNWYEIIGMIPVSHPALRGFRLLRLVRVAVILGRMGFAADRVYGQQFTYRLLGRFKNTIADAIGGAITVKMIDEVAEVLQKGTYTTNLATALESRVDQLEDIIADNVRDNEEIGALSRLPFFNGSVHRVTKVVQSVLLDVLRDQRTEQVVGEIIGENLAQIREAVRERQEPGIK